jgi:hypothetical protein
LVPDPVTVAARNAYRDVATGHEMIARAKHYGFTPRNWISSSIMILSIGRAGRRNNEL